MLLPFENGHFLFEIPALANGITTDFGLDLNPVKIVSPSDVDEFQLFAHVSQSVNSPRDGDLKNENIQ